MLASAITVSAASQSTLVYGGGFLSSVSSLIKGEPPEVTALRAMELSEEEGEFAYYFSTLEKEEQRVYQEILMGVRNMQTLIYLTSPKEEAIDRAYQALLLDHSELFWMHGRGVTYKTLYSNYATLEIPSLYSKEEIEAAQATIDRVSETVNAQIAEESSDYEKAKAIYRYVIQNTVYENTDSDQNIKGSLVDGKAVCAGYARAVQYLLDAYDIPCVYVTGESQASIQSDTGHAWNLVQLDGEWYYLDATNGDQPDFLPGASEDGVLYDYLCPMPEDYKALSQESELFSLPECTGIQYNDALLAGDVLDFYSYETVEDQLRERLDEGRQILRIKYISAEEYQRAMQELVEQKRLQDLAGFYMEYYGLNELQYHYGTLEELRTIYILF